MSIEIFLANQDSEIEACFAAFAELRPHLKRENFLAQVRRQEAQGYRILALAEEGQIQSAAGFRVAEFLAWGKVLYLDDLTTLPKARGRGFATMLLNWLTDHAQSIGCDAIHLDSGHSRHVAHRLYLGYGFQLSSHHMSKSIA